MVTTHCRKFVAGFGLLALGASSARADTLDDWVRNQTNQSRAKMLANVSPSGAQAGSVSAAAPVFTAYYANWIRDAGLVMNAVTNLYDKSSKKEDQLRYFKILTDYIDFSRKLQLTPNRSGNPWDTGLGEPKFNMDGSTFDGNWGRPQNDGPAIRAITLIHLAHILIAQGRQDFVKQHLFSATMPADTVVKADLEFVAHHWMDSSFDLWEEVRADHFYTRMVQRRALVEGAELAHLLGDHAAGDYYSAQAGSLSQSLDGFWDPSAGYIRTTFNRVEGLDYKWSNLDSSVILAALHTEGQDGFYSVTDDRMLSSVEKVSSTFHQNYNVNANTALPSGEALGVAIGRYSEDRYNGYNSSFQGNPWFLLTDALAEFYYKASKSFLQKGSIAISWTNLAFFRSLPGMDGKLSPGQVLTSADGAFYDLTSKLRAAGDATLRRVRFHGGSDYSLSEQFNRENGYMQGADDLTWSHASFLSVSWARE